MRRSDGEVKDPLRIEQFISKEQIMRVAFYDNGDIYVVPLNYGFEIAEGQYRFYFHGAKAGRKYELSKIRPSVGFEIDGRYELLEAESACDYSAKFQSVIGTGVISIIDDLEEKERGLNILMKQVAGEKAWHYSQEMLNGVAVFRLDVEKISCKAK